MTEARTIYDQDLDRNPANYVPLTPISFLLRSARVWGKRTAVVHGEQQYTYAQMLERCRRLGSALERAGVGRGQTVAVMAPNVPALLEAHYGVAMAGPGAVLCALNTRLDAAAIAFMLRHSEAKVLLTDREYSAVIGAALAQLEHKPLVIDIDDPVTPPQNWGARLGEMDYEAFLASGAPDHPVRLVSDEWSAIALGYTSGTTSDPKGVVTHHRGAHLNAVAMALEYGLNPESVYLWTLPMFHCNGWTYTWAVTLAGGMHICLRKVDPAVIFPLIERHGVTHMCGAPVVMNMLINAPEDIRRRPPRRVHFMTGGAAPPQAVIERMEALGFAVHHLYGLTETYGPATTNAWQPELEQMDLPRKAAFMARQGVEHPMLEEVTVMNPNTMERVPADGKTMGEIMMRGNTVMMGYLKNPKATASAFAGGWFHSGDLAVLHPDGYVEIKDRSKDIIISGGENISSIEVEDVLYRHPAVLEAAVVAHPDEKWGEVPHAFVTLKEGMAGRVSAADIIAFCRENMAHYKCPRYVSFGPLPKTSTGKIQKFALREMAKTNVAAQ
jgi:fatty-acyl-CoA synthase